MGHFLLNKMKNIILIISIILLSCNSEAKFSSADHDSLNDHKDKIVHRLAIKRPVVIVPFIFTKGHKNRHSLKINGFVTESNDTIFVNINLSLDIDEMHKILRHEMVHVWQVDGNRLKTYPHGWVFKGQFIPANTPYNKRTHELEAKMLEGNRVMRR